MEDIDALSWRIGRVAMNLLPQRDEAPPSGEAPQVNRIEPEDC